MLLPLCAFPSLPFQTGGKVALYLGNSAVGCHVSMAWSVASVLSVLFRPIFTPLHSVAQVAVRKDKNFNNFFENALTINARQMPFNFAILVQFCYHPISPLIHCGSALCAISADESAFRDLQKVCRVNRCPSTARKVMQAKRHEKNLQFFSGHFDGKTLGNQKKTAKKHPKFTLTIMQLLTYWPRRQPVNKSQNAATAASKPATAGEDGSTCNLQLATCNELVAPAPAGRKTCIQRLEPLRCPSKESAFRMTHSNSAHLFISYANEDLPLARWLARKLAVRGHPVWFDKIKSLAGGPWPHTMDETIKSRTFRMLALLSKHSLRKKKPALERMLAQRVVRQQNISDFLIPLIVDDTEPDALPDAAVPISFDHSWGDGWNALLKKLDSIKAPRSLENGGALASASFPRGRDLINDGGEPLFANLVRIQSFPNVLRVFQAPDDLDPDEREALEDAWTFFEITRDTLIAVIPPPPEFFDRIRPIRGQLHWTEPGMFQKMRHREIASAFIFKALARRLLKAGCSRHPDPKFKETFFLPETYAGDGQLPFTTFEGKKLKMPIREKVSFRRVGGIIETNFHHFAFRLRLARGGDKAIHVQVTPTLVFFDEKGGLVADRSALARLRRVTKTWNNEGWLNRVTAAQQILTSSPPAGANDPALEQALITLRSPRGLEESIVESDSTREGAESLEQEFELEEPETEEADE